MANSSLFVRQAVTVLTTIVISMTGFWLMIGREYTTRAEVSRMIDRESPYVQDRNMILEVLADNKDANNKLRQAIDNNTRVIVELRTVMEFLRKDRTLP